MNKQEFMALDEDARFEWLKEQTAAGKELEDILAEIEMGRPELQAHGYTFAAGQWFMRSMALRQAVGGTGMGGVSNKAEGWAQTF